MPDLINPATRALSDVDALYLEVIESDTAPLTRLTISKKHVRILVALFMLKEKSVRGATFANLEDLQELVALITYKRYPYLDIVSFANDLHIRGYADTAEDEDGEKYYKITDDGVLLLEQLALVPEMYLEGSKTPNFYPIRH